MPTLAAIRPQLLALLDSAQSEADKVEHAAEAAVLSDVDSVWWQLVNGTDASLTLQGRLDEVRTEREGLADEIANFKRRIAADTWTPLTPPEEWTAAILNRAHVFADKASTLSADAQQTALTFTGVIQGLMQQVTALLVQLATTVGEVAGAAVQGVAKGIGGEGLILVLVLLLALEGKASL